MLSYSHHKKEIKNLSYDGLFLYFWKQEVWVMHILAFILMFVVGAIVQKSFLTGNLNEDESQKCI